MPRRGRSSSPMSSAPRRTMTSAAPARPPPQQTAPVPVAPPASSPMAYGQPQRGPGMMGQIAATAAGVGIGSAIGHTVGHAITGGFGGSDKEPAVAAEPQQQMYQGQPQQGYYQSNQANADPCGLEMKQFLECAQQNSNDISLCSGFNEVLKSCRIRSNPQQQQYMWKRLDFLLVW